MKKTRRVHSPEFKAVVAIAAVQAGGDAGQVSHQFGVHRNLVRLWRNRLVQRAEEIFSEPVGNAPPSG